ncbi:hypothetical protein HYH03_007625 [Edaphochlamys debaryana]|nr:hypothetical protein HYH03_007625 [Edaphochlamys debaryana]|eukprot:KAG2494271.1 hypothetical protein HYH03_007625 [Edaphochlamys debaryana]
MYECMKYGAVDTGVLEEDEWQLAHAGDVARALVEAMRQWHLLPRRSAREVSTGTWVSARQLAAAINATARSPCAFHFTYNSVADTPGAVTALGSSAIGYALSSGAGPPEPSPPPPPPPAPPRSPSAEGYRGLVVSSNLTARLQELARSSAAILEEEASWRQREPYLSIILATSNDEYSRGADGGGVRSRTQNLIASIVETADAAHLDYEFVVVQYGPYVTEDYTDRAAYQTNATDVDLPFTQLFPWRHRRGFGRMRVITIPRGVFSWPNGEKQTGTAWPEFVAKNAGALRSRGKYLLFTNADDVYPHGIFAKIAQQQLEPSGVVYRAGIFLETVLSPKQSMAKQCDAIAAAADLCYFKNMACPDSQPRRNDSNHYYIGDFSIWSRADFFRTGGYLEYPQNTHLETGHWDYARDTFGLVNKWFDQFTCHQSHHRNPYAPTLVRWDTIAEMHANRTRGTSVGLTGVELPAAAMHDVLAAGYNPLEPFTSRAHDPVYGAWAEHLQSADLDPAFLHDFLGVRTNYEYDCRNMSGTRFTHLGRRIACDRHDEFVRRRRWIVGPVLGDLPVLDEEYYAWLVLLRAAKAAAARAPAGGPSDDPFVVIELGADYGAWLVRAAVALRRLQPARRVRLLGVEGSSAAFERLQEHVSSNGLAGPNSRLLRGWAGAKPQGKSGGGAGAVHSIPELLAEYNAVDFLHVDVGGAEEEALLEPATLESLTQRVRNIHVRTHSANSHAALARSFKARGWRILHDLPGGHGAQPARLPWSTPFGPMLLRGPGLLSLEADATSRRGLR